MSATHCYSSPQKYVFLQQNVQKAQSIRLIEAYTDTFNACLLFHSALENFCSYKIGQLNNGVMVAESFLRNARYMICYIFMKIKNIQGRK